MHSQIVERLLALLLHVRAVIGKRSSAALAAIGPSLSDEVFSNMVSQIEGLHYRLRES